jgi:16S rRNA (cytosine967-C5)-methyltransferase
MNSLNSRRAALALLLKVIDQRIMINSFDKNDIKEFFKCDDLEIRAAMRLTLDCLRHFDPAQALLKVYIRKAPPKKVLNILRLGVVELCVNQRASYGVVDDAVKLTHELKSGSAFTGLVNAILRKVAADGLKRWPKLNPSSLPAWIARPIKAQHGKTIQKAIERIHSKIPPIDLTVKYSKRSSMQIGEVLPNGSLRMHGGAVSKYQGYKEGFWWVQNAAASIPVSLLGNIKGKKILDLCAAPGGKTMQLVDGGAQVTALDISENRMTLLKENLERVQLKAELIVSDILEWENDKEFDTVLLDAPCSATGTIRRHPDLPFVKNQENLDELINLQKQLLQRAFHFVKPGGELIYCTCSLLFSEGEAQIEEFLLNHPTMSIVEIDFGSLGLPKEWESLGGCIRTRPDYWRELGGLDGFFISHLRKNNS